MLLENDAALVEFKAITLARFASIMPRVGPRAALFIRPLNAAMEEFKINTLSRQRMFVAQIAHETGQLSRLAESFDYTPERMRAVFNTSHIERFTPDQGELYGRTDKYPANQQKIASIAYANRMGNGDPSTGDGWKYRGRGLIQTTGRDNYLATMLALDIDCIEHPELLEQPVGACRSAAWFWKSHGLNELADKGDFHRITKILNGGYNGMEERLAFLKAAERYII